MYKMFFPSGNAEEFCDHVFRTFDMDKNGYIDFKVIKILKNKIKIKMKTCKKRFFFSFSKIFIQDLMYDGYMYIV